MTDINVFTTGIKACECGRDHLCPIDCIEIAGGALNKLPELCEQYEKILLVADKNTDKACGREVADILGKKATRYLILENNGEVVIPNEEILDQVDAAADVELIIGIGSGVINDICKYISFKHNIPYYIVATAPSMDGYASVGAALILGGMKVTLNARPPKAIIADTNVLCNAPMDMLRAGYGDIIGKFSCLNDWKLSALINGEYFCQRVYDLTYSVVLEVKQLADGIKKRDEAAVGALMKALCAVGIFMSYVGNSRPASGSEHHLSHYFEITGILNNTPYFSHGIDVAFASVVTAKIRDYIINNTPCHCGFDRNAWESNIRRIYSTSADGIIALQDKLGWYQNDDFDTVLSKWDDIIKILREAPSAEETLELIEKVGLSYNSFKKLYGRKKIKDGCLYAKDLKDRYSVLWLFYSFFKDK